MIVDERVAYPPAKTAVIDNVATLCISTDVMKKQELRKQKKKEIMSLVAHAAAASPTDHFVEQHVFYTEALRDVLLNDCLHAGTLTKQAHKKTMSKSHLCRSMTQQWHAYCRRRANRPDTSEHGHTSPRRFRISSLGG